MALPQHIRDMAEFSPIEDILLYILRRGLPGIPIQSMVEADQDFPFVLVRRADSFGNNQGDERFLDSAQVVIHTFTEDPNGDEDAALLAEAVRVKMVEAHLDRLVIPGRGHITSLSTLSRPHRSTDWATASGPVQYADLPVGVHRYEVRFELTIRKPRTLIL